MAKPPATAVSKNDFLASVPSLERRLFLCRFTPFHLRFRHLLPVFQDNKARGGIRGNGSKDLSHAEKAKEMPDDFIINIDPDAFDDEMANNAEEGL